jgi:predicted nucleic acid-binding Zn ribbon protein
MLVPSSIQWWRKGCLSVKSVGRNSLNWRNASTAETCSARRTIRITWLGSGATRAWLRRKESYGGNERKHHPRVTSKTQARVHVATHFISARAKLRTTSMSKYLRPEQQKASVPKHRHCTVCATPISMEKEFCGPTCEDQFKRSERKRKYVFILILAMFPALLLVLSLLRS